MNEQPAMMNQQQQQLMNLNQNLMNPNQINPQPQPQMVPMNLGYGMWAPQPQPQPQFQNPNPGAMKPPTSSFKKSLGPRNSWKGKKVNKLNDKRRNEQQIFPMPGSSSGGIAGGVNTIGGGSVGNLKFNSYQPPTLNELQHQNRLKTRKFFPKKKFNKNMNMNMGANNYNYYYNKNSRSAPYAPRNTTSFIIRAKKSGGIASLVSPSPMTPAVLPTPIFSPAREVLVDMAKEEWGVDGYGSMKGLIRLRSKGHGLGVNEDEEEDEGGSSESDVEEHVEVERRLDHDLSRFEMIYDPNNIGGADYQNVLENRVDDQDTHIAQLEEENLILKERLFLMERELVDLRRRMHYLERRGNKEEGVEDDSENESHGEGTHSMEDNGLNDDNIPQVDGFNKECGDDGINSDGFDTAATMHKSNEFGFEKKVDNYDSGISEVDKDSDVEGKEEVKNEKENNEILKDIEGANYNEKEYVNVEMETVANADMKSSEHVVGGDICMEEETVVAKNADNTGVEAEGENKNEKVSCDGEEKNNHDEKKCLDVKVNAGDNVDIESSEDMANMDEVGVAEVDMGLQSGSVN